MMRLRIISYRAGEVMLLWSSSSASTLHGLYWDCYKVALRSLYGYIEIVVTCQIFLGLPLHQCTMGKLKKLLKVVNFGGLFLRSFFAENT